VNTPLKLFLRRRLLSRARVHRLDLEDRYLVAVGSHGDWAR
jgi:hypothetical protein